MSKACLQDLIMQARFENHVEKCSAFSALRQKKTFSLSEYSFGHMCREVVSFGAEYNT